MDHINIYTERLILRSFKMEDAYDCFAFLSDAQTCRDDGGYAPYTEMNEDYWNLMNCFQKQNRYMIELKKERKVIGTIHLMSNEDFMEIGYVMAYDYRRKGYAYEALDALIRILFQFQGLHRLEASCYDYNKASICLLEKLGFKRKERIMNHMINFYLDINEFTEKDQK